jgi:hypothetical protein
MDLRCFACGKTFRSMTAEAKHRHNFPALCTRNRQFARFVQEHAPAPASPPQQRPNQGDPE